MGNDEGFVTWMAAILLGGMCMAFVTIGYQGCQFHKRVKNVENIFLNKTIEGKVLSERQGYETIRDWAVREASGRNIEKHKGYVMRIACKDGAIDVISDDNEKYLDSIINAGNKVEFIANEIGLYKTSNTGIIEEKTLLEKTTDYQDIFLKTNSDIIKKISQK